MALAAVAVAVIATGWLLPGGEERGTAAREATKAAPTPPAGVPRQGPASTPEPADLPPGIGEGEEDERAPTQAQSTRARRVARRFMAGWLAYAAGRAPVSALRDAVAELRDRLDELGGRQPTGVPTATACVVGLERQRRRNPRLLVAAVRVAGAGFTHARVMLAWAAGRWRVTDLRVQGRTRRFLGRLPYEDRRVRILALGRTEADTPILAVVPKRGGGEQAIAYTETLIRRAGDDPATYTLRFGGE